MAAIKPNKNDLIDEAKQAYAHITNNKTQNHQLDFILKDGLIHITMDEVLVAIYTPKTKRFLAPRIYQNIN